MILVLDRAVEEPEVRRVLARLEELGLLGRPVRLGDRTLVHVTDGPTRRARRLLADGLVQGLIPTSGPRVRREGRRFHPYHSLRIGALLTLVVGGLGVLAGAWPRGVGEKVLPGQAPPDVVAWPWYLHPFRAVLGVLPADPAWVGPLALVLMGLGVLCLPLLDRTRGRTPRERLPVILAGAVVIALVAFAVIVLGGGIP